jgi:secreted PhoX family phosphatase
MSNPSDKHGGNKPDQSSAGMDRRSFVKGSLAGAATISFGALLAQRAHAVELPYTDDYGPVAPVNDETTGLPLIALPAGFKYRTFGWRGQLMDDGVATPGAHDGMDVVSFKGPEVFLVRNHEHGSGTGPNPFIARAGYDNANGRGGTTNLAFNTLTGRFSQHYGSLSGTVTNCAGGRTPWGSWITCEETGYTSPAGVRHGWCFDVPGHGTATAEPLTAMGRFSHEAIAVDEGTGNIYETEDATPGGFYKFVPNQYGNPAAGGSLYALAVKAEPNYNFSGLGGVYVDYPNGATWEVEWVPVTDPEALLGRAYNSAAGRASFARPEGAYFDSGKIYFVCTSGGVARQGQVFEYDPRREVLTIIFNSAGRGVSNLECNNPDNIAVSNRGGIILCEDGGNDIQRMRGLSQNGKTFIFAENRINLSAADIAHVDAVVNKGRGGIVASVAAGSHSGNEWAGACFHGKWMFVNIQTPGVTFAITGPWDNGAL